MTSEKFEVILCNNGEKGGGMLIFNPYDLDHVGMLNEWLADKKKGIDRPCPFYTKSQLKLMSVKKKNKRIARKGLLRQKS